MISSSPPPKTPTTTTATSSSSTSTFKNQQYTNPPSTSIHTPNQFNPNNTKTSSNSTIISQSEISSILSACSNNFRFDGRSNLDIRPYTLLKSTSTDSSSSLSTSSTTYNHEEITPILSNGSSRLCLPGSNTDIICSIKADIVHPPQYQVKNEGLIELNIDILPFASTSSTNNNMDRKSIRKEEMEVTSTLMHLLIPHLVDKEQLVIVKGRFVWRLYIDVFVMHCDGNLMDCCSMAIWGAMQNVKLPHVTPVVPVDKVGDDNDDNNVDDNGTATKRNMTKTHGSKVSDELILDGDIAHAIVPDGVVHCPIVVTICLLPHTLGLNHSRSVSVPERYVTKGIESVLVVDATKQEESCASTKVSVSVDPRGNICGIHKYGNSSVLLSGGNANGDSTGGTIPFDTLSKVQNSAILVSKSVFEMLKNDVFSSNKSGGGITNNFFRGHFELQ